jgi:hypothetical protein
MKPNTNNTVLGLIEKDIEQVYGSRSVTKLRTVLNATSNCSTLNVPPPPSNQISWLNSTLTDILRQFEDTTETRLWLEDTNDVAAYTSMFKENVAPTLRELKII